MKSNMKNKKDEFDLAALIHTLLNNYRVILAATLITTLLGLVYILLATPIYKADALVQVEKNDTGNGLLSNLSNLVPTVQTQSSTEIELMKSRMILGKTVNDLNLNVEIKQKTFPIFGRADGSIALSRLKVPAAWYDQPLILEVIDPQHYILKKNKKTVLEGTVGKIARQNNVSLLVSGIKAKKGTKFQIVQHSDIESINYLLDNFSVMDKGKDTGILELSLLGTNPALIQKVLDQIANNYLAQNVERKSAEAAKSLAFLNVYLPNVHQALTDAESKLNRYRQQHDSIDLSLEAKSILDLTVQLEAQLNELTFKEAEISKLYTKQHPAYRALLEKRQTLLDQRDQLAAKITDLPETQQEILSLTRDAEASNQVYMQLLNKQQELRIAQASTVGNVRIVDRALTQTNPVKPRKTLILIMSMLLGMFGSIAYLLMRELLRNNIENVEQLEELGISVYASIPLSEWQSKQDQIWRRRKDTKQQARADQLVAIGNPSDLSVEALRSLRTSLHFAMMEAKNNIVAISGCSPEIGKSFVATNLAVVLADTDKRILVIDADMRKGYLHNLFQADNKKGLSGYLSGQLSLEECIQKVAARDNLDFIARSAVPPNPSELLMHARLSELMEWATNHYDMVFIDTPPILAVTDAAIIGKLAGATMLVVRYGKNTIKEVELGLQRFSNNNVEVKGIIFNGVVRKVGSSYQYGYEYHTNADK